MTGRRRTTLSDVALRAGVSRTTASYALNGQSGRMRISAETQTRVRRAARELGYRPNRSARSLRTGKTRTVGLVLEGPAGGAGSGGELLAAASLAAAEAGHLLVIGETGGDPAAEQRVVEDMVERQVDGVLYAASVTTAVRLPALLHQQRTVLLNCHAVPGSGPVATVVADEVGGGRRAAELLVDRGIAGDVWAVGAEPRPRARAAALRTEGIAAGLREAGAELAGVVPCAWQVTAAYDALLSRFQEGFRPRALVCLDDRIAMGAYRALRGVGLAVPDDVAVVGFDGYGLGQWLDPPVTSLTTPYAEMGRVALRRLLAPGPDDRERTDRLAMPVVEGRSLPRRPAGRGVGATVRGIDWEQGSP